MNRHQLLDHVISYRKTTYVKQQWFLLTKSDRAKTKEDVEICKNKKREYYDIKPNQTMFRCFVTEIVSGVSEESEVDGDTYPNFFRTYRHTKITDTMIVSATTQLTMIIINLRCVSKTTRNNVSVRLHNYERNLIFSSNVFSK